MNWNVLKTYKEWSGKLSELLAQAHDAIAAKDVDKKLEAQRALNEFIDNCASPVKGKELDDIASRAIGNLFEATLDQCMAEMGKRTAELTALTKDIAAVTDAANASAANIRLDSARKVIDTTVQAVEALKSLKQQLDSAQPDEKQLADTISTLITSIQTVRNQVETLNHPNS